ncbi:PREDICTED: multidrug and toxin extrusion protein 1-like isoform X1 [Amphimedon queenslandica]|uniref:Multidrug and toxin extrusion protein n=1 Tax=Amphimedon queenslandica TaxID=400682 RepID=A0AAN0JQC3_AMPQE|nr:PREDICTED: multidrug and toxin extrusion protein 1-like isoform X1 [Amphimedon queenslandica]|eukprot:XP_019859010.1 PREDICTED: multidrug and toxin extrusion protein 1-like isoform X1 [Amphimedon queenslandica]
MGEVAREEAKVGSSPVNGWVVQTDSRPTVATSTTGKVRLSLLSLIKTALCGWIKLELITLIKLALPIILTLVFQNMILFISLIFVGHINDRSLELDSVALAGSFGNITGISVGIGLSSAADTLCSQTFGYKNYKRVGHIFQRGVVILLLLSVFVCCIWLNTDSILLLLQQAPCVAKFSGTYVQIFCLALPPFFVYWMLQKYFQAQSIVWPFIFTGALSNVACAIFHAIFVVWADLGVNGAAISMVLSYYCFAIFLIIYIRLRKLHAKTWDGWSWESLNEWGQFLKLGIPGVAMTCLEWVSFEIAAFVLGSISEVELAVNSIMVNVLMVIFMIPLGISIAAGVRIGNELGAGNPQNAKRASLVAMAVVFTNTVIQVICLQATKFYFGLIYTKDSEVLSKIPGLVDIVCILLFADQLQLSLRGVVLGCGQQVFASVINFIAFYIIGLPIGISLALLTDLGSRGMWSGLATASYFQLFCLLVFMARLNWKKESDKAILRSKGEEERKMEDEERGSTSDEVELVSMTTDISRVESKEAILQDSSQDTAQEKYAEDEEEGEAEQGDEQSLLSQNSGDTDSSIPHKPTHNKKSQHVRLLLTKGSVFLFGIVLVVAAGIASMFHPPESIINGNYSECIATTSGGGVFEPGPIESSILFTIAPTPTNALDY